MRIELDAVSDTHDNLDYVKTAVPHFKSEGVDTVVHYGDVVASLSVTPFDVDFDLYTVCDNNGGEWALREAVESFGIYHDDFAHLTLDGQEIAVYRDTEAGLVDALVDSGTYDFVLRGHSHEWVVEHRGATTHINPSSLSAPGADGAFHAAVVDLDTGDTASWSL